MKFILVFLFCFLFSCGVEKNKNQDLIKRSDFKNILIDFFVQDSVLNITEFDTLLTKEFKHKHSITQNNFDLTIDYYFENIEELDLLYQEILDSIIMLEMN